MQRFEQVCRQHGLRLMHQPAEILPEIAGTEEHSDAETVYRRVPRRIPAVSLGTVYRTLGVLEQHGLLRRAEAPSGPTRCDANVDRHHHFVCTGCGPVRDVYSEEMDNLPVSYPLRQMGAVTWRHVHLRGIGCRRVAAGDK